MSTLWLKFQKHGTERCFKCFALLDLESLKGLYIKKRCPFYWLFRWWLLKLKVPGKSMAKQLQLVSPSSPIRLAAPAASDFPKKV